MSSSILSAALFPEPEMPNDCVAIFDGASVPDLPARLAASGAEHCCLYVGAVEPALAAVAPWLVRLEPTAPLFDWLAGDVWRKPVGILAVIEPQCRFVVVRRHFRALLTVRGEDGGKVLFRYYDQRVLGPTIAGADARKLAWLFGPVAAYLYVDVVTGELQRRERHLLATRSDATGNRSSSAAPVAVSLGAPVRTALAHAAMGRFVSGSLRYLEDVAPQWHRATSVPEREAVVRGVVDFAHRHHLVQEVSLRRLAWAKVHHGFHDPLAPHVAHRLARQAFSEAQRVGEFLATLHHNADLRFAADSPSNQRYFDTTATPEQRVQDHRA